MSVKFKPGDRKTMAEAADAFSSVLEPCTELPDPAADVLIVKDETIEEDAPWNFRDLTSNDDRDLFALQAVQYFCQAYGPSISPNV